MAVRCITFSTAGYTLVAIIRLHHPMHHVMMMQRRLKIPHLSRPTRPILVEGHSNMITEGVAGDLE